MSEEADLREQICLLAKSMFDRGLTGGSSGNISARLSDGRFLVIGLHGALHSVECLGGCWVCALQTDLPRVCVWA